MTSALPSQTATATDTTRDTAREGAKCRHGEGERKREGEEGGVRCLVLSPSKKTKTKKGQWRISATMETYLVTAPAPTPLAKAAPAVTCGIPRQA